MKNKSSKLDYSSEKELLKKFEKMKTIRNIFVILWGIFLASAMINSCLKYPNSEILNWIFISLELVFLALYGITQIMTSKREIKLNEERNIKLFEYISLIEESSEQKGDNK